MSVALATLVTRLQAQTPQRNGQPADYEQVVRDAVTQLGRDVPVVASTPLAIVAGTERYALPADFVRLIDVESVATVSGVNLTTGRLLAMPLRDVAEQIYIEGDEVRIAPTPVYSATRTLRYGAGYTLATGVYPRLTEHGARLALLYGQHLALMAQAADAAAAGWKYQIGDEMVDRSQHGRALREAAESVLTQYTLAVRQLRGYGQRGRYGEMGEPAWG